MVGRPGRPRVRQERRPERLVERCPLGLDTRRRRRICPDRPTELTGEYLYVDLGSKDHTAFSAEDSAAFVSWSDSAKFYAVRVGLNCKF